MGGADIQGKRRLALPVVAWGLIGCVQEPASEPADLEGFFAARAHRRQVARLGHPAARAHRPWRALPPEPVPHALLARLEEAEDYAGQVAIWLATGHPELVDPSATSSAAGGWADRAAAHLAEGAAERALDATTEALTRDPAHPVARWNDAVARARLGLPRSAADGFRRAAEVSAPAWAEEAHGRASALEAEAETRAAAWRSAVQAGMALRTQHVLPDPATLRAAPGVSRLLLYDAIRTATSAAQVARLRPLARAVDEAHGGGRMLRWVDWAARQDFEARRPLAARYRAHLNGDRLEDGPALERFLAAARRADARDIAYGALYLAGRETASPEALRDAAEVLDDAWFEQLSAEVVVKRHFAARRWADAEALAERALEGCRAPYRCATLRVWLANAQAELMRLGTAEANARRAIELAIDSNERALRLQALMTAAKIALYAQRYAEAEAYVDEVLLEDDDCRYQQYARWIRGSVQFHLESPAGVFAATRDTDGCPYPVAPEFTWPLVDAARMAADTASVAYVLARIERFTPRDAFERADAILLKGRLLIDQAPERGARLLSEGLARARPFEDVPYMRTVVDRAHVTLGLADIRAGRLERALERAERSRSGARTCGAVVLYDDHHIGVVARAPEGAVVGGVRRSLDGSVFRVPSDLFDTLGVTEALRGCPEISVIAPPPVAGTPGLLPDTLAWSYRLGGRPRTPVAPARPRRLVVHGPARGRLALPPLPTADLGPDATALRGADATPAAVLEAARRATEIEIYAHGWLDVRSPDAALLLLAPGEDGQDTLTGADLRAATLEGRPVVYLAACQGSGAAPRYRGSASLPEALIAAGARAVIATPEPIVAASAPAVFAALRRAIRAGASPAVALRDARRTYATTGRDRWVRSLMVFTP